MLRAVRVRGFGHVARVLVCFGFRLRCLARQLRDPLRRLLLRHTQDVVRLEARLVGDLPRSRLGSLDDRVHLVADGGLGYCPLFLWTITHRSSFVRAAGAPNLLQLRVRIATCNAETLRNNSLRDSLGSRTLPFPSLFEVIKEGR